MSRTHRNSRQQRTKDPLRIVEKHAPQARAGRRRSERTQETVRARRSNRKAVAAENQRVEHEGSCAEGTGKEMSKVLDRIAIHEASMENGGPTIAYRGLSILDRCLRSRARFAYLLKHNGLLITVKEVIKASRYKRFDPKRKSRDYDLTLRGLRNLARHPEFPPGCKVAVTRGMMCMVLFEGRVDVFTPDVSSPVKHPTAVRVNLLPWRPFACSRVVRPLGPSRSGRAVALADGVAKKMQKAAGARRSRRGGDAQGPAEAA